MNKKTEAKIWMWAIVILTFIGWMAVVLISDEPAIFLGICWAFLIVGFKIGWEEIK